MGELLSGFRRSGMCASVNAADAGKRVSLCGWVQRRRDLGKLIFIWLRDYTGIVQVVFDQSRYAAVFDKATALRSEFVIAVRGTVEKRTAANINPELATGEVEVIADELIILNESQTPPFAVDDNTVVNDGTRYKYRYIDLRRPAMQRILRTRSKTAISVRNYFNENGFAEIETPVLCKSTPEGARDYLVPSRVHPGKFYALPQSPQLLKQLLMVGGMDRYFQIVKCFRDEDLRADRQPEFTQIDVEMSFVEQDQIMEIAEGMLSRVFREIVGYEIPMPIERMTYKTAMEKYGSDKPDLRFGLEIRNISGQVSSCGFSVFSAAVANGGSVRGINGKGLADKLSRKDIDALGETVKTYRAKGLAWMAVTAEGVRGSFVKFLTQEETASIISAMDAQPGDILFFVADSDKVALEALGQLRLELARRFELYDKKAYRFVWITEFPMFEYSPEDGRYYAVHHPFTAPMDEDLPLLDRNPGEMRAKAYDIVLNGYELGGGSIRIHDSAIQNRMFEALGLSKEDIEDRFGFLVDAFKYGAPPHGGFAIGMDRLIMLLCGTDNIKDVIAFPKMQNAACLMTGAPDTVDEAQLEELSVAVTKAES
ncbi:MAG: aspartate--tRNA ligase [Firmicutes bacterium]|nr:aspartate--tRNA ligase [Bacillota bacterium]